MAIEQQNDTQFDIQQRHFISAIVAAFQDAGHTVVSSGLLHGGGCFIGLKLTGKHKAYETTLKANGAQLLGTITAADNHVVVKFQAVQR